MHSIRTAILGALLAGGATSLAACSGTATPTPTVRIFTGLTVAAALAGPGSTTHDANGVVSAG